MKRISQRSNIAGTSRERYGLHLVKARDEEIEEKGRRDASKERERERDVVYLLREAYESRSQGGFPPKDRSRLRVALNAVREHRRRLDNTSFAIVLSTRYPPCNGPRCNDHYDSPR